MDKYKDLIEVERSPDGRYVRYDNKIGAGAYKSVYLGHDTDRGIDVAWNVINARELPEMERARISQETKILKNLKHPNIIDFYHVWETEEGKIVFTTEIVSSGTLKDFAKRSKDRPKLKVIKRWCRQILEVLKYLHTRKPPIIHRDLKCDNIFINGNTGELKVGDLGLSTAKGNPATVLGTPEFMAPEMYDEKYSELVDIYAFGMCVLELCTNEYPYQECGNPAQIYKKVVNGEKPRVLQKILDKKTLSFIEHCISNESERLTAVELLNHPFLRFDSLNDSYSVDIIKEENVGETQQNAPQVPKKSIFVFQEEKTKIEKHLVPTSNATLEDEADDECDSTNPENDLEVNNHSSESHIKSKYLHNNSIGRKEKLKTQSSNVLSSDESRKPKSCFLVTDEYDGTPVDQKEPGKSCLKKHRKKNSKANGDNKNTTGTIGNNKANLSTHMKAKLCKQERSKSEKHLVNGKRKTGKHGKPEGSRQLTMNRIEKTGRKKSLEKTEARVDPESDHEDANNQEGERDKVDELEDEEPDGEEIEDADNEEVNTADIDDENDDNEDNDEEDNDNEENDEEDDNEENDEEDDNEENDEENDDLEENEDSEDDDENNQKLEETDLEKAGTKKGIEQKILSEKVATENDPNQTKLERDTVDENPGARNPATKQENVSAREVDYSYYESYYESESIGDTTGSPAMNSESDKNALGRDVESIALSEDEKFYENEKMMKEKLDIERRKAAEKSLLGGKEMFSIVDVPTITILNFKNGKADVKLEIVFNDGKKRTVMFPFDTNKDSIENISREMNKDLMLIKNDCDSITRSIIRKIRKEKKKQKEIEEKEKPKKESLLENKKPKSKKKKKHHKHRRKTSLEQDASLISKSEAASRPTAPLTRQKSNEGESAEKPVNTQKAHQGATGTFLQPKPTTRKKPKKENVEKRVADTQEKKEKPSANQMESKLEKIQVDKSRNKSSFLKKRVCEKKTKKGLARNKTNLQNAQETVVAKQKAQNPSANKEREHIQSPKREPKKQALKTRNKETKDSLRKSPEFAKREQKKTREKEESQKMTKSQKEKKKVRWDTFEEEEDEVDEEYSKKVLSNEGSDSESESTDKERTRRKEPRQRETQKREDPDGKRAARQKFEKRVAYNDQKTSREQKRKEGKFSRKISVTERDLRKLNKSLEKKSQKRETETPKQKEPLDKTIPPTRQFLVKKSSEKKEKHTGEKKGKKEVRDKRDEESTSEVSEREKARAKSNPKGRKRPGEQKQFRELEESEESVDKETKKEKELRADIEKASKSEKKHKNSQNREEKTFKVSTLAAMKKTKKEKAKKSKIPQTKKSSHAKDRKATDEKTSGSKESLKDKYDSDEEDYEDNENDSAKDSKDSKDSKSSKSSKSSKGLKNSQEEEYKEHKNRISKKEERKSDRSHEETKKRDSNEEKSPDRKKSDSVHKREASNLASRSHREKEIIIDFLYRDLNQKMLLYYNSIAILSSSQLLKKFAPDVRNNIGQDVNFKTLQNAFFRSSMKRSMRELTQHFEDFEMDYFSPLSLFTEENRTIGVEDYNVINKKNLTILNNNVDYYISLIEKQRCELEKLKSVIKEAFVYVEPNLSRFPVGICKNMRQLTNLASSSDSLASFGAVSEEAPQKELAQKYQNLSVTNLVKDEDVTENIAEFLSTPDCVENLGDITRSSFRSIEAVTRSLQGFCSLRQEKKAFMKDKLSARTTEAMRLEIESSAEKTLAASAEETIGITISANERDRYEENRARSDDETKSASEAGLMQDEDSSRQVSKAKTDADEAEERLMKPILDFRRESPALIRDEEASVAWSDSFLARSKTLETEEAEKGVESLSDSKDDLFAFTSEFQKSKDSQKDKKV